MKKYRRTLSRSVSNAHPGLILTICLTAVALTLTGCASYEYQRQSETESCSVEITSMRDPSAASLAIQACDVAGTSEYERAAIAIVEVIKALQDDK